ncbi:hypothetical protein H0S70_07225 [Chryseobacterium manosquense]|uniref:Uncharacterized protein n=1 Tax=Chryseobacterium manosquense TaxID=2754694 RepID=A0A7H1DT89_9FLAO|nr:hypothetical protein [Chryseobacterium manosquense]QNS40197.1 hypothetical protein H0S70_07225 [Chryseobacterium manosquense]
MNLEIFVNSLNSDEKRELLRLLANELLKKPIENLTEIGTFIHDNRDKISTRLRNILIQAKEYESNYIELIDSSRIHLYRNASKKTESEFIELRGW